MILHGRAGIRFLSSSAASISHSFASLTREILSAQVAMQCSVYYIDIDEMSRFETTCFIHFRNDEKVVTNR